MGQPLEVRVLSSAQKEIGRVGAGLKGFKQEANFMELETKEGTMSFPLRFCTTFSNSSTAPQKCAYEESPSPTIANGLFSNVFPLSDSRREMKSSCGIPSLS